MEPMIKSTISGMFSQAKRSNTSDQSSANMAEWEFRPGGMLVQKRNSYGNQNSISVSTSTVKVKVKYGSSYHEIRISSHASFGELKKMLAEPTGLHPQDQKLIFKKKERDSKSYLDEVKVKDGSKMVVVEDIDSRQRRTLETSKIAKKEKTSKLLSEINLEVDKLAKQVAALKACGCSGGIMAEKEVDNLTENLMRILIKLDEIVAEGDLKLQRREQVGRVQKQIETLDKLKVPLESKVEQKQRDIPEQTPKQQQQQQQPLKHSESAVVTTKWETFD